MRGLYLLGEVALGLPARGDRPAAAVLVRIAAGTGAAATADALGCTTRTLHRRCIDHFGHGPAVLRRVLRFRRAAALLYSGVAPTIPIASSFAVIVMGSGQAGSLRGVVNGSDTTACHHTGPT